LKKGYSNAGVTLWEIFILGMMFILKQFSLLEQISLFVFHDQNGYSALDTQFILLISVHIKN